MEEVASDVNVINKPYSKNIVDSSDKFKIFRKR